MAQGCLKCLKYTMCVVNLLCFVCGTALLGFGVYMMMNLRMTALTPSLANLSVANMLLISGIIITCVSFIGFLGALKENRCLLLTFFLLLFTLMLVELAAACFLLVHEEEIGKLVHKDLTKGLEEAKNSTVVSSDWDLVQNWFDCCGIYNHTDWGYRVPQSCCKTESCASQNPAYKEQGCLTKMKNVFEDNFLSTGIAVIVICIIEVLGMCFAMTLFCHISRSGLGYKL
ncbi:leukocyte surface antigen CD53-like [Myripristis murdjan]|uniref:Tetraspanin n=1 Tax=Myripristis murdjan TaxID=586833 RepID=A0A667XDH8_9TELE|nr:leukocyte surface antigen CD53-like [Myripristis murdjan]XP_029916675.1 leukocyte surface antigen CD53-like [Myripristis murdjan]